MINTTEYCAFIDCAHGWTYFRHTKYCYRHFNELKNWEDARTACRQYRSFGPNSFCSNDPSCSATLATIHDNKTNDFLVTLTKDKYRKFLFNIWTYPVANSQSWIGLSYRYRPKREWFWDDGSPYTYEHFAKNEGEGKNAESYVEFNRFVSVYHVVMWLVDSNDTEFESIFH